MPRFEDLSYAEFQGEFRSCRMDNYSQPWYLFLYYKFRKECPEDEMNVASICCDFKELSQEDLIGDYGYLVGLPFGFDGEISDDTLEDLVHELSYKTIVERLPCGYYLLKNFSE